MSTATRNKRAGAKAETAARDWLHDHYGWDAQRLRLNGQHDLGDITGVPNLAIEVKSCQQQTEPWRPWIDQAIQEAKNAKQPDWVVFYRPARTPNPDNWLVLFDAAEHTLHGVDWAPLHRSWHQSWKAQRDVLDALGALQSTPGVLHAGSMVGAVDAPTWFTWWADRVAS